MGFDPEPWRPENSLEVELLLQLDLSWSMGEEFQRADQLTRLGRDRALELWGWSPTEARAWIPPGDLAVAPRALGRGIPVLSTRVGGLGEVIEDGVNGRLVEPGSHYEIPRVLHELADPDRLATLTDGARRTAGRYTWAGYVKTLEALMIEVLG